MPWTRAKTTVTNVRKTFLRTETDGEYRARLKLAGCYLYGDETGSWLDRIGEAAKVQRKLLEDVA